MAATTVDEAVDVNRRASWCGAACVDFLAALLPTARHDGAGRGDTGNSPEMLISRGSRKASPVHTPGSKPG